MSNVFNIKQNDTSPAIKFELEPVTVDLTGATVRFKMRRTGAGEVLVDELGTVEVATGTPTVAYQWGDGDTANIGSFQAEFEVQYAGGAVETFPNVGFISVIIHDDI